MTVRIVLEPYDRAEFILSKYFIQDVLTGSLFAQALEDDPDAKELPIPNPVVTPKIMRVLVNLSRGLEPISYDPELRPAAIYLNCERLMVYTYRAYDHKLVDYSEVGYDMAIQQNALCVVKYRLRKGYKPSSSNLWEACRLDCPDIIHLLLHQPNMHWVFNDVFEWACREGHIDIVEGILSSNESKEAFGMKRLDDLMASGQPLILAAGRGHLDIVKRLLKDSRLNHEPDAYAEAKIAAQKGGYLDIVALL